MGAGKKRRLSGITTVAELREARRELELREWFARQRLSEDVADTFTVDNLISIIVPPGSVVDRIVGGIGTGLAAVQGIAGVFGSSTSRKISSRKFFRIFTG